MKNVSIVHTWIKQNMKIEDKISKKSKLRYIGTLLKRGSSSGLAFGVAKTLRFGNFIESGLKVFKWQWSSRLCVISKQSISGRSLSCTKFHTSQNKPVNSHTKNLQKRYLEILHVFLGCIIKPGNSKIQITHQDWINQYFQSIHIPQPRISLNKE